MEVAVHGRRSVVPDDVRELVRAKVAKVARRAPVLERADVKLGEDPSAPSSANRSCELTVTGHGHVLRAHAEAHDLLVAADIAVEKLEHQVERLKGKLIARSHPRRTRTVARS
ncbi:MAG TPA: ribosome-associated translation inhibitor RaiA [Acidimicrobiales bacterium]|nr:ribosome-associated translation inhibitor RaiA [Acidimicrobiales bacterium]